MQDYMVQGGGNITATAMKRSTKAKAAQRTMRTMRTMISTNPTARAHGRRIWSPQAVANKTTSTLTMRAAAATVKGHQVACSTINGFRAMKDVCHTMEASREPTTSWTSLSLKECPTLNEIVKDKVDSLILEKFN